MSYIENSQQSNFIINISIDGNSTGIDNVSNGVVTTPNGDIAVDFAPMISSFTSNNYGNAYSCETEIVLVGPSVTKERLVSLGIDPEETVLSYSIIEVWFRFDIQDEFDIGFWRLSETEDWTTGEKIVSVSGKDNTGNRTSKFHSLILPQPENDDIFVLSYGDNSGINNITATVSCNGFVPIHYQNLSGGGGSNTGFAA